MAPIVLHLQKQDKGSPIVGNHREVTEWWNDNIHEMVIFIARFIYLFFLFLRSEITHTYSDYRTNAVALGCKFELLFWTMTWFFHTGATYVF